MLSVCSNESTILQIITEVKILEEPELLLEARVDCELSFKRILAKEKVKYSLLLVHSSFPISIRHGYLVEIRRHGIHQFVSRLHLFTFSFTPLESPAIHGGDNINLYARRRLEYKIRVDV
jgi:hypothetical protein